jgi:hypothetical protein
MEDVVSLPSPQVVPVAKAMFLDVVSKVNAIGLDKHFIPSKLEGLAFGQDVVIAGALKHTLYIANDNDFLAMVADPLKLPTDPSRSQVFNPNQWYVFAFSDNELPGYVPQPFKK